MPHKSCFPACQCAVAFGLLPATEASTVSSGSDFSVREAFASGRREGGWPLVAGPLLWGVPSLKAQCSRESGSFGTREWVPSRAEGVRQGWSWVGFTYTAPGILYPSEKYGSCLFLAEQMDELLQRCFLHALKCQVKKADLPLLTSTLLGSHMFSCWYGRQGVGRGAFSGALVVCQDRMGELVEGHAVETVEWS